MWELDSTFLMVLHLPSAQSQLSIHRKVTRLAGLGIDTSSVYTHSSRRERLLSQVSVEKQILVLALEHTSFWGPFCY